MNVHGRPVPVGRLGPREGLERAFLIISRSHSSSRPPRDSACVDPTPAGRLRAGADGSCDVSPRGDAPGFVRVLDDAHLAIPDRKGNNRIDALRNIVANPHAGLLFVVPGIDDTLRVNGRATVVSDEALLATMEVAGRRPASALVLEVVEAFLHCGRAFKRGQVWDPSRFAARGELPTLAQMLAEQTAPDAEEQRMLDESEREDLW